MKKILLISALIIAFSCKKKEEVTPPVKKAVHIEYEAKFANFPKGDFRSRIQVGNGGSNTVVKFSSYNNDNIIIIDTLLEAGKRYIIGGIVEDGDPTNINSMYKNIPATCKVTVDNNLIFNKSDYGGIPDTYITF